MNPALVWSRITGCFLVGLLLGPLTDALRPFHRRFPWLTQIGISAGFFAGWLYCGFGLCRSDLRLGYYLAILAGFALWEGCFGRSVTALFGKLWHIAAKPLLVSLKIFQNFKKFLFSRGEKWSTMYCRSRQIIRRNPGGPQHD